MDMRKLLLSVAVLLGLTGSAMAQDEVAAEPAPAEGGEAVAADAAPADAAATEEVAADGGGSEKKISVGLLLGYGIDLESGPNAYGLGFGVRGGYNLDKIFLGARFVYYLGSSSWNIWEFGIEGGYDLSVGDKLIIRPGLGLGLASLTVSYPSTTIAGITVGGGSASSTEFYIAPGASLLYDVSDSMFLGAEARLEVILGSSSYKGLILLANAGMRF